MINILNECRITRTKACIMMVLTGVLWSLAGVLIKWISWNPFAIAGIRSGISVIVILLYVKKPKINWSLPQVIGALAYATTVISFVVANKLTTAANAILLQYTSPIYVLIFGAWFLKEKATLIDWVSVFLALSGMVMFFLDDLTSGHFLSNLIAIFSGLAFATMVMLLRKQKDQSPIESVLLGNIVTAILGIPFMFKSVPVDLRSWIGILILGVFQLGLSYILYSEAIKHVTALEGTLIPIIEPILNPLWVFLAIGETPGPWSIIGGIVVLISITGKFVYTSIHPGKTNITNMGG